MKKILLIVRDMRIGGVPQSLLSFLQCFVCTEYIEQYEVHLLVLDLRGELMHQIPRQIWMIQPSRTLRWMSSRMNKDLLQKYFSVRGIIGEASWLVKKKLGMLPKHFNIAQKVWLNWQKLVPGLDEIYDVVVSYQDGESNYYAMDKVNAQKKVLWVHSDYQEQGYDPAFDKRFYEGCDAIVTISEKCRRSIEQAFPELANKIHVLENITSSERILSRADEAAAPEYEQSAALKLLSVGRLNWQKGFDIAIDAAKMLRENGEDFLWLIVGEGSEREKLQQQIDANGVSECFKLIGARENPYSYMKACDILVQSSRIEGKSIVLDEAKIFCKPIIATNYTTVKDSIEHGTSGWVVDMTPQALCDGITRMMHDQALQNRLCSYLENQPKGNIKELQRYIQIVLEQ